jgi:hypothetical protein
VDGKALRSIADESDKVALEEPFGDWTLTTTAL